MKFRKKSLVVEAMQWFKHGDHPAVIQETEENRPYGALPLPEEFGVIPKFGGMHIVAPGDWILTRWKGKYYPCKPDIFEMTYEKVDAGGKQ
jgi:hypothetical protein